MDKPNNNRRDYILSSHDRCKELGIDSERIYSNKIIEGKKLQKKLEEKRDFILTAQPFMDQIYNFVKGSNFFAIITDEEGCILSLIGDEDILDEAFSLKMVPGAYMAEENVGTNAMGTALAEGRPVQISADEHYIKAYHRWTCSGAPVKDENGDIIGSIDLTGYCESVHPHTLGMVAAASNAIENMIEVQKCGKEVKISKVYTETIINSITVGILTADLSGNIKVANNHIVEMFGYSQQEIEEIKIWDLFEGWKRVKDTVCNKSDYLDEDVFVKSKRNKLQFNLSAYPILDSEDNILDIVFVFKEVKKVRKLANKILGRQAIYTFDKIIGQDNNFTQSIKFAQKVADSKSTVLIMGESGTGKEVFAQAIHNYSNRKDESFVALNCGAIPKNLIESELFGYVEGAFTGAKRGGQPGKFEIADCGTIFLDEIGEMPLDLQTRLLRVIEEGTVSRIGGTYETPVNVRIIAATNKDLLQEVHRGNFRKDLYYRLNVLPLRLIPLRQRKDDIPLLLDYFMDRISRKLNKKRVDIPKEYMNKLTQYEWPGNVRELENLVELIINTESIPVDLDNNEKLHIDRAKKETDIGNYKLDHIEKQHITKVLKKCDYNITQSAEKLGIGRNTLYRKINKYEIQCPKM